MRSRCLIAHSSRGSRRYAGHYAVTLVTVSDSGERENPSFARFENGFKVLRDYITKAPVK